MSKKIVEVGLVSKSWVDHFDTLLPVVKNSLNWSTGGKGLVCFFKEWHIDHSFYHDRISGIGVRRVSYHFHLYQRLSWSAVYQKE